MKYLLLFCFLAYVAVYPDFHQLLNGSLIHLGPYDALVKIGNLSKAYKVLDDQDLLASKTAKQFIEEARRMFRIGFSKLPPLDPYVRAHLPVLDIDAMFITSGKIRLINLNMTGAQGFNLEFLEIRIKAERIDFGFNVSKINVEVDVSADGEIVGILPIHFSGHLSLVLKDVSILAALQLAKLVQNEGVHYRLIAQHSRLHAEDVAFKFTKIKIDDILKYKTPSVSSISKTLENLKNRIDNYTASFVLQQTNSILLGLTANQILAHLLPEVTVK